MDFKRALVRPQKGTFCKPIKHLLEAKRACIGFKLTMPKFTSHVFGYCY